MTRTAIIQWLRDEGTVNLRESEARGIDPVMRAWHRGRTSMCCSAIRRLTVRTVKRKKARK